MNKINVIIACVILCTSNLATAREKTLLNVINKSPTQSTLKADKWFKPWPCYIWKCYRPS